MGTSRIKIIDLSAGDAQIKTSRKRVERGVLPEDVSKLAKKVKKEPPKPKADTQAAVEPEKPTEAVSDVAEAVEKKVEKSAKKEKPVKKVRSKRYIVTINSFDKSKSYPLKEAVELVKKTANTKFDSTIEAHLVLTGQLQGTLVLPHPFAKKRVILVFAGDVPVQENVIAGGDKTISDIRDGKLVPGRDFQAVFATPQYMPKLAQIAKTLGPKGLMPNPKTQTIIDDPKKALKSVSLGQVEYKTESQAPIVHLAIGKASQSEKQLEENIQTLLSAIGNQKIEKIYLASTMGPSVKVDPNLVS